MERPPIVDTDKPETPIADFIAIAGGKEPIKSCPNQDCDTSWAPDALLTGQWKCPACNTIWE